MPAKEETLAFIKRFYESTPHPLANKMEKTNIGIGMVLRYLSQEGRPVSAAEISRYMNVSTARVAVLLRTMLEKDLVVKTEDDSDARKVCISLSDKGEERIQKAKDDFIALMTEVVEKVGMERMETFLQISCEIKAIVLERVAQNKEKGKELNG